MSSLLRWLRLSLVVILLISVCTLAFVAYTQHEEQQQWEGQYNNATQLQQYWQSKYEDAVAQLPVTLALSRFANFTDIGKTEFMDSLHQKIEPVKIEMHGTWYAVTFWFEKHDVGNGTILLHLPNQSEGSYSPIDVPFFDIRLLGIIYILCIFVDNPPIRKIGGVKRCGNTSATLLFLLASEHLLLHWSSFLPKEVLERR